jgi:Reverse transcriptase (RNA-dependent DNA polymerase)
VGIDAVLSELGQLHDREVMIPVMADSLDPKAYLMFLKKKRCGKIKGRGCADGCKQRLYTTKQDASSPTVSIESLMISCIIDAKENREVITLDIPGAFMQVDMDEIVHMRLEGTMADLVVKLSPETYESFVIKEKGKNVLYVQLKKALYGTLRAALLFWKKLTEVLRSWGSRRIHMIPVWQIR